NYCRPGERPACLRNPEFPLHGRQLLVQVDDRIGHERHRLRLFLQAGGQFRDSSAIQPLGAHRRVKRPLKFPFGETEPLSGHECVFRHESSPWVLPPAESRARWAAATVPAGLLSSPRNSARVYSKVTTSRPRGGRVRRWLTLPPS